MVVNTWMTWHKTAVSPIGDITWASRHLISPAIWLFVQKLVQQQKNPLHYWPFAGIIVCMCPANERRCYRYSVKPSLIGQAHTQNDPCVCAENLSVTSGFSALRDSYVENVFTSRCFPALEIQQSFTKPSTYPTTTINFISNSHPYTTHTYVQTLPATYDK